MIKLALPVIFIFLLGCIAKKNCQKPRFTKHTIEENHHRSDLREIEILVSDTMCFQFFFPESSLECGTNQINNILGFSNSIDPRFSSGRVGWRCTDSSGFDIYANVTQESRSLMQKMLRVHPNDTVSAKVIDTSKSWIIEVECKGESRSVSLPKFYGTFYNWRLNPYYGKKKPSKDIAIYILEEP